MNISSGTNLQALIDAQNTASLPNTRIVLVLSNRKAAYGLTRATNATPSIPTAYLALQPFLKANPGKTRDDYDIQVSKIVLNEKPDVIVLAGWMHVFGDGFLNTVSGETSSSDGSIRKPPIPVINLHPALPGAFDGANAIQRAYEAFQKDEITTSGVMVHRVVKEVDRGEPVLVREVKIERGEPIETYEKRLHRVEWEIIVEATAMVLEEVAPLLVSNDYLSKCQVFLLCERSESLGTGASSLCERFRPLVGKPNCRASYRMPCFSTVQ